MKIAVVGIRGIPAKYGGFETCAEEVCRRWIEAGHDVVVYCRRNLYAQKCRLHDRSRLYYVPSLKHPSLDTLSSTLLSVLHLILFVRDAKYVHLYNTGNGLFIPLLKLARKTVLISVDGIEWKRKKWGRLARLVHQAGARLAVWLADCVITDNLSVERYYRRTYSNLRAETIPYGARVLKPGDGAHAESVLSKHGLKRKEYFVFVGRLVPEKGVHLLLQAYRRLRTSYPLVVIGDDRPAAPYRRELMRQRSEKIRFLGYVYGSEYESLLANALMYVSASELEGTSPSLLAAMGAGVCALVNGIEENHCSLQGAGYYFRENDVNDLCRAWQEAIDSPDRISAMAQKGRDHALQHYSWDVVAQAYISLFHRLRPPR